VKIENRQQLLVVIAIAAAALLIGDRLILTPLLHAWKTRATKITALRKQLEQGTALIQREPSIVRRWDQMRRNALPTNPSLAEQQLLRAFDAWARDSRATLTAITPQWKHGEADEYMTLECRVDTSGNLETLCNFLYNIEKDAMALRLTSVELASRDENGQQMTLGLQVSGLVLSSAKP